MLLTLTNAEDKSDGDLILVNMSQVLYITDDTTDYYPEIHFANGDVVAVYEKISEINELMRKAYG